MYMIILQKWQLRLGNVSISSDHYGSNWIEKTLEIIYFSFIRPCLEYADVVWDNCTNTEKHEIEKIQHDAAFIVTGATRSCLKSKGQITISSDPSPLFGIQFLAIPFAFDFAFKMHIKEKSFKHSIN